MRQVSCGLAHLHQQGILHRDVKPSNLLVSRGGAVKIGDFGISTVLGPSGHCSSAGQAVVGSTCYMSPERIRGQAYGSSADIWGLGLTCAECALGVFPVVPEGVVLSADAEENPLQAPLNMFDLEALVAEDLAVVQWAALCEVLSKFTPPGRPTPCPSPA
eukprot:RCo053634